MLLIWACCRDNGKTSKSGEIICIGVSSYWCVTRRICHGAGSDRRYWALL